MKMSPTRPTRPNSSGNRDDSETLADAINRACNNRGDDDAFRAGLLQECAELPPKAQADLLEHFNAEAMS